MNYKKLGIASALFISIGAKADELIRPRSELIAKGYTKVSPSTPTKISGRTLTPHSLSWPVQFQDAQHTLGNNMINYQQYDSDGPYFHGGDDLRTTAGQSVVAPVAGTLSGGNYSYTINADGSLTKYMLKWPKVGQTYYFELSITTPDGYVFEFHHIDRSNLPKNILALLNAGGGAVTQGTVLGQVILWPEKGPDGTIYNHTHYNIVDPSGIHLNPEYYSTNLQDGTAPEIQHVFAVLPNGTTPEISAGASVSGKPTEFVVGAISMTGSDVYVHTPSLAQLVFDSGPNTTWDFRQKLAEADGTFPPILNFFRNQITLSDGSVLETQGNYENNYFLLRLAVPASASGNFTINIGDQDNVTAFRAKIP